MKMRKAISAILIGVMAAATLSAGVYAEGDKIEISVTGGGEDSMNLNTAVVGALNGLSACRHVYEGLYKLDADGNPVLGQAESVDISDDMMTWTFTLRDDINWSDGTPVVASDFTNGFKFLEDTADDYSMLLADIAESYDAPDDKTVVLNLKFPCGYLPAVLAFPSCYPVRMDFVEEFGEGYATDPDKSVYNGPFEVTDWVHESEVTMTLRDDYYDAANISVGTIHWILTTDEGSALSQFESGELVYSDLCPDEEKPRMDGNGLVYTAGNNNYCVMFNQGPKGNDVLKDVKVRKALALAIDRDRIMAIRDMNDEPGLMLACSGYKNADGVDFTEYAEPWFDLSDYEANCEEAKKLLAEAGYENGEGFPALTYIVNNDSRKEIAEAVCNDWKEVLGIDTNGWVQKVENFFATRTAGDYDLAYYGWFMDYTDLSNMFGSMNSMENSNCFWKSDAYLEAYNAGASTADEAVQWENYAKCEAILAEELPITVILHSMSSYLYNDIDYSGLIFSCGNFIFTYITEN